MNHLTDYVGEEPVGGISYNLWHNCPIADILADPGKGIVCLEDFEGFGRSGAAAANVGYWAGRSGSWKSYEDSSTGFSNVLAGGVLEYDGTTSDNLEGAIQRLGAPFVIAASAGKPLWFEAIGVKKELVTNTQGFLFGLAETAAPANSLIADAGNDIADIHYLGGFGMDTDGDTASFIYQDAGDAFATPGDDIATLAAATAINLGFYYDGVTIVPYINGVAYPSYKITAAQIAASDFPSDTPLSPIFAHKQGANVDQYTRVDGIYCVQLR